jgi:hypothetical protein
MLPPALHAVEQVATSRQLLMARLESSYSSHYCATLLRHTTVSHYCVTGSTVLLISADLLPLPACRPYLIVGPLSTLPNWVNEFKRFCPSFPVILYHGSKEQRAALRAEHMQARGGWPPGAEARSAAAAACMP